MSAHTKVTLSIRATEIVAAGLKSGAIPSEFASYMDLASGTSDGQCDLIYSVRASSVAASTTTSYDLAGGVLKDAQGTGLTFVEVCLIALKNRRSTALAYLTIGPHGTNGFGALSGSKGFWPAAIGSGGGSVVGPCHATRSDLDSFVVLHDITGVPVTASTADILAVVTSGVTGSDNGWDLLVVGRSA